MKRRIATVTEDGFFGPDRMQKTSFGVMKNFTSNESDEAVSLTFTGNDGSSFVMSVVEARRLAIQLLNVAEQIDG